MFCGSPAAQIDFEMRPPVVTNDTFLVSGIVFCAIHHRMRTDRVTSQVEYGPTRTRMLTASGAIEIEKLCARALTGWIQGVTLPGIAFVYRAGSTFGIRIEPTNPHGR